MEIKIRSLLDGLEDSSVPMEGRDVVSAMRIKELTNMKLNGSNSKVGRGLRRRALSLALAAALVLAAVMYVVTARLMEKYLSV